MLKTLTAILTATAMSVAVAVMWLPIMKYITSGPRANAFSWRWDLKEYVVFWVRVISWMIIIVPLIFFSLFMILKGKVFSAALYIFISLVFYSIQKAVGKI